MWHPRVEGKTSFSFTVHLPEPPGHQAWRAPPKDSGTRAPNESWTCSSLASRTGKSSQPPSKSLREALSSLWKASVVVHDPRSLEGHLQRPCLAQRVGSFMQVVHKERFLLACLGQMLCSRSRIDPRCELALQMHLQTFVSPSCQVLHPHPSSSSRGMINTCCNETHQFLLFPPLFAAGSGSHALISTSRFAELLQAEKILPTHHITALSTPKSIFADSNSVGFFFVTSL